MEFHPSHLTALTLAGTVPLPSPYPACGSVSVVIVPHGEDFEVFVKIVQVVSDRRIITRFVRPEDVRAIRAHPEGTNGYGPESWPVRGSKTIQGELDRRSEDLLAGARTGVFTESLWYHSAIVYVPESAPVLHRNDVGVTAAVSAEEVGFSDGFSGCCHPPPRRSSNRRPAAAAISPACHPQRRGDRARIWADGRRPALPQPRPVAAARGREARHRGPGRGAAPRAPRGRDARARRPQPLGDDRPRAEPGEAAGDGSLGDVPRRRRRAGPGLHRPAGRGPAAAPGLRRAGGRQRRGDGGGLAELGLPPARRDGRDPLPPRAARRPDVPLGARQVRMPVLLPRPAPPGPRDRLSRGGPGLAPPGPGPADTLVG